MNKFVGQRIRFYRISKNISQETVSGELKISKAAYSNLERGITAISVKRLDQIATILNIAIVQFFKTDHPSIVPTIDIVQEEEVKMGYAPLEKQFTELNNRYAEVIGLIRLQQEEINRLKEVVHLLKYKG